jgi:hypothetical protein
MPGTYYLVVDRQQKGPFTRDELGAQGLRRETLVWHKGLPDWVPAGQVRDLIDVFDEPPPVPSEQQPAPATAGPPGVPEAMLLPPMERNHASASDHIRDLAVNVPRSEAPHPSYPDDADELPPPIGRLRIPYDAVGIHRLYLGGTLVFVPGLVLLLCAGVAIAVLGIYGVQHQSPRFDPQRKDVVFDFDPDARSLETLWSIAAVTAVALGLIGLAIGASCYFVLLYRAWAVIQDGRTYPTPGRAVGFLFIPFFNVYWAFVAIWGLSRALNRFVRRYDLEAPSASQPLGFAISLYSALTYLPIPFAGLVPLGLNLVLLPLFMRSVYRTVAAICDDVNRDRIVNTPLERTLRQPILTRPVSAHILSIVAAALAPIGVALVVIGFGASLNALHYQHRDMRINEARRQGIDHLRGLGGLNQPDANRLRDLENRVNVFEHGTSLQWRDNVIISSAVFGGGVLLLTIALALAFVSRICARATEEAASHPPPI